MCNVGIRKFGWGKKLVGKGLVGQQMDKMKAKGTPAPPPPPTPPATESSVEAQSAGAQARADAKKRRGQAASLLAGETGGYQGASRSLLGGGG